jgi:hypothetical protein
MDWSDILKFIVAILWPLVTVVALVLFRRPLTRLASEIAVRTTKVSFKGVSVEFQRLTPLAPAWSVSSWSAAAQNVHTLTSSELFDSYSSTLFDQLLHSKDADYAVVDLGRGEEWLTSRLYIFSLVLGEISRLSALVFLETVAGGRRRFLGVAAPGDVRSALARRYPWLEHAFAVAYAAQYPAFGPDAVGQSISPLATYVLDASNPYPVMQLVREFVSKVQRTTEPPQLERPTYLSFQTTTPASPTTLTTLWERAGWIDGERLERDLAGWLQYSWYADSPDLSQRAKIEGILRRRTRFVALVDEDRRFVGLVDR